MWGQPTTEPTSEIAAPSCTGVYAFYLVGSEFVKIGYTRSGSIADRRKAIAQGVPFRVILVGWTHGGRELEHKLHVRLRPYRVEGLENREFFYLTPEVRSCINEMRSRLGLAPWENQKATPPITLEGLRRVESLPLRQRVIALKLLKASYFVLAVRRKAHEHLRCWMASTDNELPFTEDECLNLNGAEKTDDYSVKSQTKLCEKTLKELQNRLRKRIENPVESVS